MRREGRGGNGGIQREGSREREGKRIQGEGGKEEGGSRGGGGESYIIDPIHVVRRCTELPSVSQEEFSRTYHFLEPHSVVVVPRCEVLPQDKLGRVPLCPLHFETLHQNTAGVLSPGHEYPGHFG